MEQAETFKPQLDLDFVADWGRRFGDAWNALDPDAVAALCTDDVVYNDHAMPGPAHGRDAVGEFVEFTAKMFPDFRVEETSTVFISPIEPLVLCPYRMTGTLAADWPSDGPASASFAVEGIDQWRFRGELLCHYVTYYDKDEIGRQLGWET